MLLVFLSLPQLAGGAGEAGAGGSGGGNGSEPSPHDFFMNTLQCLQKAGKIKKAERMTPTMEAFSQAYEEVQKPGSEKAQRVKTPTRLEMQHMLAQILIETGYLEKMTENGKENEQFSGRGFIQITGADNYKSCAAFMRELGGRWSRMADLVEVGGSNADRMIGDKAPNTSEGLTPAALCTLAWWAEAKKNEEFKNALMKDDESSARTVSRIVNKGPGSKPGEEANHEKKRVNAFNEVKACAK